MLHNMVRGSALDGSAQKHWTGRGLGGRSQDHSVSGSQRPDAARGGRGR